jgi:hypothetical protein
MNFPKKVLNFRFLLEKQTEIDIFKDLTYHPQPKKGYRAAQMGQNMTQNGSKNSLKQPLLPPKKRSAFNSFHQFFSPDPFLGWIWHFCSLMIIYDHIPVPFAKENTH